MKKKLLITGASGFLGYHLLRCAGEWDVYGITHSKSLQYRGATIINCDITNYIELGNYFDDIEPDAVIHIAAIADASYCQQNPAQSELVNIEATKNIAGICSDYQIPFAFTSTDLVFDGKKGMYTETDERNPLSIYGEHKAKAEDAALEIYPDASIFRIPLMYGALEASSTNYFQKFIGLLKNGEAVNLFNDEYRSICGAKSVSQGLLQLTGKFSGVLHLAGSERLSRYEFGVKAANAFNLPVSQLNACSQKDIKSAAPRPADVSLNINKAISFGFAPQAVDEELKLIATHKYFQ